MRMPAISLPLLLAAICSSAPAQTTLPADPPPPSPAAIAQLIESLGDPAFEKREAASAELKRIGEPAIPALRAALKDKDPEIQQRAGTVLRDLTVLTPSQIEFHTARATAAAASGDFIVAATNQHILARRFRPTINDCVLLGHYWRAAGYWTKAVAGYERAIARLEEVLAGDPETDPPAVAPNQGIIQGGFGGGAMGGGVIVIQQGDAGFDGAFVVVGGDGANGLVAGIRGGGGFGGGFVPAGGARGNGPLPLNDSQRRDFTRLRAQLILIIGKIHEGPLGSPKAAITAWSRIIPLTPEFQADLPTALQALAPMFNKTLPNHQNISRGLDLLNETDILDHLARTQESQNLLDDAALTLARVNSARFRLRPDGLQQGVADLARILRKSPDLARQPGADLILKNTPEPPPPPPKILDKPAFFVNAESPFQWSLTNLADFKLGPIAIADVVERPNQPFAAVLSVSSRLMFTTSPDLITWDKPLPGPSFDLANNMEPALTVDDAGTFYLAWFANPMSLEPQGSAGYGLWMSRSKDGREWSTPKPITCKNDGWPPGKLRWSRVLDNRFVLAHRAAAACAKSPDDITTLTSLNLPLPDAQPTQAWPLDPTLAQDPLGALYLLYADQLHGICWSTPANAANAATGPTAAQWAVPSIFLPRTPERVPPSMPQLIFQGDRRAVLLYRQWEGTFFSVSSSWTPGKDLTPPIQIATQSPPITTPFLQVNDETIAFTAGETPCLLRAKTADLFTLPKAQP